VQPRNFPEGSCEECGETNGVRVVHSMTNYMPPGDYLPWVSQPLTAMERLARDVDAEIWDIQYRKLNPDHKFCEECAKEYNDYWTSMWNEYYQSQGA